MQTPSPVPPPADARVLAGGLRRAALVVFCAALALRLPWALWAYVTPIGDHYGYDATAWHWVQTGEYRISGGSYVAYRPPAYNALVALVYLMCGHSYTAVALVQAVLGAATAGLLVVAAGRLLPVRAAVIAGGLQTLWPTAIAYVPVLASDNLAVFLLVAALAALVWSHDGSRRRRVALALLTGACLGAMYLARPSSLFFFPPFLLLAWWQPLTRRTSLLNAALCAAALALVVTPWHLRNHSLGYGFSTITTQGGYALWWGNNWRSTNGVTPAPPQFREARQMSEIEQHRFYQQKTLAWIRGNPGRYVQLSAVRLARYFGREPDSWAAKYFWPTAENDKAVTARYWASSRWPERAVSQAYVEQGEALEARNRRWHERFQVATAPLVLLALLLALRRFRTFASVLLPLWFYVVGLALTVVAARYRTGGDSLAFVPLAALLSDLLFGTHTLGRWGGRWFKLALSAAAVAGSAWVYTQGLDRSWYSLPPIGEPNPAWDHLGASCVRVDLNARKGARARPAATTSVELTRPGAGVHVRVAALPEPEPSALAGVRIPLRGMNAVRLELTWEDAQNLETVLVRADGAAEKGVRPPEFLSWNWSVTPETAAPAGTRQTYVLVPGGYSGFFTPRKGRLDDYGEFAAGRDIRALSLLVRVRPGTTAAFTLHEVLVTTPPPGGAVESGRAYQEVPIRDTPPATFARAAHTEFQPRADGTALCIVTAQTAAEPAAGGLQCAVPAAARYKAQLQFPRPAFVAAFTVRGLDAQGQECARWEWPTRAAALYPAADWLHTIYLTPGEQAGPLFPVGPVGGEIAVLEFGIDVRPGKSGRFVLVGLEAEQAP